MTQAHFAAKQSQILAIAPDAIRKPNMPIKTFIQEAADLFEWARKDILALLGAGLDHALFDDIPARIDALREAESLWFRVRYSHEQAQQQWEQEAPKAYALRDRLLRAMRFAFRRDDALLKRVAEITAGSGHADMIQDLSDIAALGREFSGPLLAINLDLAELDHAVATASAIAVLLAQVNGERADNNSARVVRDQAYTLLKEAVDEVRACGQYALWDNETRRDGYFSDYQRSARRGGPVSIEQPADPAPQDSSTPA
ncbi:MAG TPA: hypothetical protein VM553_23075 [Dongiaceae bacterium]|nr:hypothetical protein [Dongiaceae bacterium]